MRRPFVREGVLRQRWLLVWVRSVALWRRVEQPDRCSHASQRCRPKAWIELWTTVKAERKNFKYRGDQHLKYYLGLLVVWYLGKVNYTSVVVRPNKKKQLIVLVFPKRGEWEPFYFLFFILTKMAAKQAFKFKMAANFSVQNDRQLFIHSYPTSKLSQNIHSMYFVKPNCLSMFFSIAFSLQQNANEHHRTRFKSLKNALTW